MPVFSRLLFYSLGSDDGASQELYLLFLLCGGIVLALCPRISSETNVPFKLHVICSLLRFSKIYNSSFSTLDELQKNSTA